MVNPPSCPPKERTQRRGGGRVSLPKRSQQPGSARYVAGASGEFWEGHTVKGALGRTLYGEL